MRLILAVAAAWAAGALLVPGQRLRLPTMEPVRLGVAAAVLTVTVMAGLPLVAAAGVAWVAQSVPRLVERVAAARQAAAARDRWPDFLALVRSRIGAGDPLPDAVRAAARALGDPFLELDTAWGGSFVTEVRAAQDRWSDPVADRVLTTLRVAATTGGSHVDAVLSELATSLSDEMQIRSAHDAALTQQRLTAGVALVSPWAILALSLATNPQAAAAFGTPTGRMILTGGVIATISGYGLARRAASLSAAPRVFE
jgi:Flp pilus assembly protein TadB